MESAASHVDLACWNLSLIHFLNASALAFTGIILMMNGLWR